MQNRRNRRPKKGMQRRQPSRQEGTSCNIIKRINIFGILELPDDVVSNTVHPVKVTIIQQTC